MLYRYAGLAAAALLLAFAGFPSSARAGAADDVRLVTEQAFPAMGEFGYEVYIVNKGTRDIAVNYHWETLDDAGRVVRQNDVLGIRIKPGQKYPLGAVKWQADLPRHTYHGKYAITGATYL
jgi:hypothetical protein